MGGSDVERTVLITGAAGGIGRAAAHLFRERGWIVWAVDLLAPDDDFPKDVNFRQMDISEPERVEVLASEIEQLATGKLDALVNNAAIQITKPLTEVSVEDWRAVMVVNLRAPWLLTQAVYPLLKKAHGAVVNVSSVHARKTSAEMGAYATSKGGLLGLTQRMALEFAPDGVRANAILPGATQTEMLERGMMRDKLEGGDISTRMQALSNKVPLQRVLEVEEIAEAIYFLADRNQSSSITGIALTADGGALTLGEA